MARILERRNDSTGRVSLDIPVELRDTAFEDSFEADCVNLSTGGLSLRSPCLPDVGSTLECRLSSPDGSSLVSACGEVVWAQLDGERSGEFGLRFVDLDPTTELLIEELLADYRAHRSADEGQGAPRVVQLELEGTSEAISAELTQDGSGSATFEQKLDLLQLGRAIRARHLRGGDRFGEIAGVELKLVGNTPMLAVTVDFEPREYGEFDAFAVDDRDDPEHDTDPELEAPPPPMHEAHGERDDHDAASLERFRHTTETEFAQPLRHAQPPVVEASQPSEVDLPAVLGDADPFEAVRYRSSHGGALHAPEAEAEADDAPEAPAVETRDDVEDDAPAGARAESMHDVEVAATARETGSEREHFRRRVRELDAGDESFEPPSALDQARVLARRVWPPVQRFLASALASSLQLIERTMPSVRGGVIRLRGVLSALYRRHLATGLGAARRLLAPRLPRRRRRTTAVHAGRPRTRASASMRPIAMAAMGLAALGLGVYALLPGASDEPVLHRAVQPAKAPPPRASAEAAIVLAEGTEAGPTPVVESIAPTAPPAPPAGSGVRSSTTFGQAHVPNARQYSLRMSARVETIKGIPDEGGFTVIIPGSLALDRAGPISASHRAVRRAMILNKGDRSELTIRFAEGKKPAYQVRANGTQLEIRIQDV